MLTKARKTVEVRGDIGVHPVAAGAVIHQGALVVLDAGFAKGGLTKTGLQAVGRAEETIDNSNGADGDVKVPVKRGTFIFDNDAVDPVTASGVLADCFVVDDETVAATDGAGTRSRAGKVRKLEGTKGVAVVFD